MSYALMGEAVDLKGLPGLEKMVLMILCSHANGDGTSCFPSLGKISEEAGICHRTAQLMCRRLETKGLIRVLPQDGHRNTYQITIETGGAAGAPVVGDGRTTCTGGAQEMHGGGAGDAPNPVIDPVIDPVTLRESAGPYRRGQSREFVEAMEARRDAEKRERAS